MHTPRKSLGQHFLHQANVVSNIVSAFHPRPDDHVVEIGPGRGVLTEPVLEKVDRLDVVELDSELITLLAQRFGDHPGLHIHHIDALQFDYCSIAGSGRIRIIGNLPYNISTPLLFRLLDCDCVRDMLLMLQREVVDRLLAQPGNKNYGRLSVMVQQRCRLQRVMNVAPGAFTPPPKVDSAVVALVPYNDPPHPVVDRTRLDTIVRAAFAQRRKTLRNALKGVLEAPELLAIGIDPGLRAEQISVTEYVRMANFPPVSS